MGACLECGEEVQGDGGIFGYSMGTLGTEREREYMGKTDKCSVLRRRIFRISLRIV